MPVLSTLKSNVTGSPFVPIAAYNTPQIADPHSNQPSILLNQLLSLFQSPFNFDLISLNNLSIPTAAGPLMATIALGTAVQAAATGGACNLHRHPSLKRAAGHGNSVSTRLQARRNPTLAPLQVLKSEDSRRPHSHTIWASSFSPKPCTSFSKQDLEHSQLVEELGRVFKIPSPDRPYVDKRHPYADLHVGDRWKELHGSKDWEGLLDSMDPVLRGELVRYGEFAQATYDAFDMDPQSKYCGSSKFNKQKLLKEVGLENRGYEITDFIFATADTHLPKVFKRPKDGKESWSKSSNFMGFVAVCTSPREIQRLGRRDVLVAWRGTVTQLEWVENFRDVFSPTGLDPRGKSEVMVESGFLSVYKSKNKLSRYNKESAREQVLNAVKSLVQKYKHEEMSITITGHSLGSCLGTICAYDIAETGVNKRAHTPKVPKQWENGKAEDSNHHHEEPCNNRVPVSVVSFAGPRVGNLAFKERLEELGVKVLRVVNKHDQVPKVPGIIFNEKLQFLHELWSWLPSSYHHVGVELQLDNMDSHYLKPSVNPILTHNLEAYLHLLDGYQGAELPFCSALDRDPALVNKESDFLRPELGIPPNWWAEESKRLVKDQQGRWTSVRTRHVEDLPENHHIDFRSRLSA